MCLFVGPASVGKLLDLRRKNPVKRKSPPLSRSLSRIIRVLRLHLPEISQRYNVKSLGLFGSYVRNEQKPDSDLDILVEFADRSAGLTEVLDLQEYLSDLLGVKVDLVERKGLKPYIGRRILGDVAWLQLDGAATEVSPQRIIRERRGLPLNPKREYLDYLEDILNATEKAQRFIAGMDYSQFTQDEKTISAAAHELEVIGEAAKNIPTDVKTRYPGIPWKDMMGMRDRIAHGYFAVDLEVVWITVTQVIPQVKPQVTRAIEEELSRRGET